MLRRLGELLGLRLRATDGDIGRVHDLYFDDHHWTVRYLVVDTRHWLPGRRVLLSPASVRWTDWLDRLMVLGLSRQQIRQRVDLHCDTLVNAPGYEPSRPSARRTRHVCG